MAGVVRHRSDSVFALDMVRGDLKSVPISSPQQGSPADERAWSRCSRNRKSLPGRDRGVPVCPRITAWDESLVRQELQRTSLIHSLTAEESEA